MSQPSQHLDLFVWVLNILHQSLLYFLLHVSFLKSHPMFISLRIFLKYFNPFCSLYALNETFELLLVLIIYCKLHV